MSPLLENKTRPESASIKTAYRAYNSEGRMRESAVSSSSPNATHGIDTVKIMINASAASEMRLNRDPAVETDAPFAALREIFPS